jgi:hypothetical protein
MGGLVGLSKALNCVMRTWWGGRVELRNAIMHIVYRKVRG